MLVPGFELKVKAPVILVQRRENCAENCTSVDNGIFTVTRQAVVS